MNFQLLLFRFVFSSSLSFRTRRPLAQFFSYRSCCSNSSTFVLCFLWLSFLAWFRFSFFSMSAWHLPCSSAMLLLRCSNWPSSEFTSSCRASASSLSSRLYFSRFSSRRRCLSTSQVSSLMLSISSLCSLILDLLIVFLISTSSISMSACTNYRLSRKVYSSDSWLSLTRFSYSLRQLRSWPFCCSRASFLRWERCSPRAFSPFLLRLAISMILACRDSWFMLRIQLFEGGICCQVCEQSGISFPANQALLGLLLFVVEQVPEGPACLPLLQVAELVRFRSEHLLGTAANCLCLDPQNLALHAGGLLLQVVIKFLSQLLGLGSSLLCDAVEGFQSFLVILNALDEGFLLDLSDDRLHVFLDVPLHELDLIGGRGNLLALPLLQEGLAE